jgi:hypothetical protein
VAPAIGKRAGLSRVRTYMLLHIILEFSQVSLLCNKRQEKGAPSLFKRNEKFAK